MKTTGLTWREAKNLLLTGMCERVRYEDTCYGNSFGVVDGEIHRFFDNNLGKHKIGQPDAVGAAEVLYFKVVDVSKGGFMPPPITRHKPPQNTL